MWRVGAQPLMQAQKVQKRQEWDRAAKTLGSSTRMTLCAVSQPVFPDQEFDLGKAVLPLLAFNFLNTWLSPGLSLQSC